MTYEIKAYNDCFVRYLFSGKNNQRHAIAFINAVMIDSNGPLVKEIKIENPFNLKGHITEKESILDILCTAETGEKFHIEIQIIREKFYNRRALYYWAKIYSSQLQKSEQYHQLCPVISIHLLNFNLFDSHSDIHSIYRLHDTAHSLNLSEDLQLHFLELPKLRSVKATSKLLKWMRFFKDADRGDEYMKPIIQDDPELEEAYEEYKKFMTIEEFKDYARRREAFLRDQASREHTAKEEGREEGREEAKEETRVENIQKIISRKFPTCSETLIKLAIEKKVAIYELVEILDATSSEGEIIKRLADYQNP